MEKSLLGRTLRSHLDARYLDHKHGGPEDVAGVVAPELDPRHLLHLVEVNGLDLIHALLQVRLCVQHVICRDVARKGDVTMKHLFFSFQLPCITQPL